MARPTLEQLIAREVERQIGQKPTPLPKKSKPRSGGKTKKGK